VYLNEYQMLTSRNTQWLALQNGVWIIAVAFVGLLLQLIGTLELSTILWLSFVAFEASVAAYSGIGCESYNNVVYMEKYLRPRIRELAGRSDVLRYESFVQRNRPSPQALFDYGPPAIVTLSFMLAVYLYALPSTFRAAWFSVMLGLVLINWILAGRAASIRKRIPIDFDETGISMNDQRPNSTPLEASRIDAVKPEEAATAIIAQFHAAEYSVFMGRVSSWENLQYAAWPILIGALALLAQMEHIPAKYRWWAALISTLLVYVAYQGTMVNMLYSVLLIERDLRPLAGRLIGTENFWIAERVREKTFPSNPAWSPQWPAVISFLAIALVTGGLVYEYSTNWQDGACLVVALILWVMILRLTQNGRRLKKDIAKACTPDVKLVERQSVASDQELL
jgi:hypothetical protein